MTKWLLSIVGVSFLGVLLDLIYPNGKTSAFCKSIFGIVAMIVLISPIFDIHLDKIKQEELVDENIINVINEARIDSMQREFESRLRSCGIDGVGVELDIIFVDNDMVIQNILIDSTNLVLTEKVTNINKYEVISKEIAQIVDIERERIVVYG